MLVDTLLGAVIALAVAVPLAWKWELGVRRAAVAVLALCVAWGLLLAVLGSGLNGGAPGWLLVSLASLATAAGFVLYRFYRDPERLAPDRSDVVVSPADGQILYVRRSAGGKLPVSSKKGREYTLEELTKTPLAAAEAVVVGIALSFLDVHVNRAPVSGTVAVHQHHAGAFGSLKHPESLLENERATTIIERDGMQIAVVLIASRLVRRIVSFVGVGDRVVHGQRIGAIRFGSQVDLVMPVDWAEGLQVEVGDRVTAGVSIVAVLSEGDGVRDLIGAGTSASGGGPTDTDRARS
jgi:phosphatidylserine decarboxylase